MSGRAGPDVFRSVGAGKPGAILLKLILRGLNGDAVARRLMSIPDAAGIPVVIYTRSKTVADEERLISDASVVTAFIKSDDAPVIVATAIDLLKPALRNRGCSC